MATLETQSSQMELSNFSWFLLSTPLITRLSGIFIISTAGWWVYNSEFQVSRWVRDMLTLRNLAGITSQIFLSNMALFSGLIAYFSLKCLANFSRFLKAGISRNLVQVSTLLNNEYPPLNASICIVVLFVLCRVFYIKHHVAYRWHILRKHSFRIWSPLVQGSPRPKRGTT